MGDNEGKGKLWHSKAFTMVGKWRLKMDGWTRSSLLVSFTAFVARIYLHGVVPSHDGVEGLSFSLAVSLRTWLSVYCSLSRFAKSNGLSVISKHSYLRLR